MSTFNDKITAIIQQDDSREYKNNIVVRAITLSVIDQLADDEVLLRTQKIFKLGIYDDERESYITIAQSNYTQSNTWPYTFSNEDYNTYGGFALYMQMAISDTEASDWQAITKNGQSVIIYKPIAVNSAIDVIFSNYWENDNVYFFDSKNPVKISWENPTYVNGNVALKKIGYTDGISGEFIVEFNAQLEFEEIQTSPLICNNFNGNTREHDFRLLVEDDFGIQTVLANQLFILDIYNNLEDSIDAQCWILGRNVSGSDIPTIPKIDALHYHLETIGDSGSQSAYFYADSTLSTKYNNIKAKIYGLIDGKDLVQLADITIPSNTTTPIPISDISNIWSQLRDLYNPNYSTTNKLDNQVYIQFYEEKEVQPSGSIIRESNRLRLSNESVDIIFEEPPSFGDLPLRLGIHYVPDEQRTASDTKPYFNGNSLLFENYDSDDNPINPHHMINEGEDILFLVPRPFSYNENPDELDLSKYKFSLFADIVDLQTALDSLESGQTLEDFNWKNPSVISKSLLNDNGDNKFFASRLDEKVWNSTITISSVNKAAWTTFLDDGNLLFYDLKTSENTLEESASYGKLSQYVLVKFKFPYYTQAKLIRFSCAATFGIQTSQLLIATDDEYIIGSRNVPMQAEITSMQIDPTDPDYYQVLYNVSDFGYNLEQGYFNFGRYLKLQRWDAASKAEISPSISYNYEPDFKLCVYCGENELSRETNIAKIPGSEAIPIDRNTPYKDGWVSPIGYIRIPASWLTQITWIQLMSSYRTGLLPINGEQDQVQSRFFNHIIFNTAVPTVGHRAHKIGINIVPEENNDILTIGTYNYNNNDKTKISLQNRINDDSNDPGRIDLDLARRSISYLILDGGSWDEGPYGYIKFAVKDDQEAASPNYLILTDKNNSVVYTENT